MRILYAWSIKFRRNKKLIAWFACKLRGESNDELISLNKLIS